jgi:iron complex outermembrane receptor protein
VRVPTRLEDNAALPGIPNINPDLDSEELISLELGMRHIFNKDLFVEVAGFANKYDNLIAQNFATDRFENVSKGESQGLEITTTFQATDYWKLLANYSFFNIDLHGLREDNEFAFPRNMANLKSFIDLNDKLQFNTTLSYSDNISRFNAPSIIRLDIGLTYRPDENTEISIWGQNLTDSQQGPEMVSLEQGDILEVERAIFAKITWKF